MKLPEIMLDSMEIWIVAEESKVYFVYADNFGDDAHLLSIPLQKK